MPADNHSPATPAAPPAGDGGEAQLNLGYVVEIDNFSGPLDLLLFLVRRTELDIIDIPILLIIDQFVEAVGRWQDPDLETAGDFILMAATLLEIKARAIAPPRDGDEPAGPDDEIVDPRSNLISSLLRYRRFKEAARLLEGLEEARAPCRERQLHEIVPEEAPDESDLDLSAVDVHLLLRTCEAIFLRLNGLGPRTVLVDDIPMGVRIERLVDALRERSPVSLAVLLGPAPSRLTHVAMMLAVLESTRQGLVAVGQERQYGEIALRLREAGEAVTAAPPAEAEEEHKRRRRLPLLTYQAPLAGDDGGDLPAEEEAESDEQRFLRELEEASQVDALLAGVSDLDAAFAAYCSRHHPELLARSAVEAAQGAAAGAATPATDEVPAQPAPAAAAVALASPAVPILSGAASAEAAAPAGLEAQPAADRAVAPGAAAAAGPAVDGSPPPVGEDPPAIHAAMAPTDAGAEPSAAAPAGAGVEAGMAEVPGAVLDPRTHADGAVADAPGVADAQAGQPPPSLSVPMAPPASPPHRGDDQAPPVDVQPPSPGTAGSATPVPPETAPCAVPPAQTPASADAPIAAAAAAAATESPPMGTSSGDAGGLATPSAGHHPAIVTVACAANEPPEAGDGTLAQDALSGAPPCEPAIEEMRDLPSTRAQEIAPAYALEEPPVQVPTRDSGLDHTDDPALRAGGPEDEAAADLATAPAAAPRTVESAAASEAAAAAIPTPAATIIPPLPAASDDHAPSADQPVRAAPVRDPPTAAGAAGPPAAPAEGGAEAEAAEAEAASDHAGAAALILGIAPPARTGHPVVDPHPPLRALPAAAVPAERDRPAEQPAEPQPAAVGISGPLPPLPPPVEAHPGARPHPSGGAGRPLLEDPPPFRLPDPAPDPDPEPPGGSPPRSHRPPGLLPASAAATPATLPRARSAMSPPPQRRSRILAALVAMNCAWLAFAWLSWVPRDQLEVVAMPPALVEGRLPLRFTFNLDMVGDAAIGRPPAALPEVRPALAGSWAWHDARTLEFAPSEDLPAASAFNILLARDALRAESGLRLAADVRCAVHTARVAMQGARLESFAPGGQAIVVLDFNQAVDPALIARSLAIADAGDVPRRGGSPAPRVAAVDAAPSARVRLQIESGGRFELSAAVLSLPGGTCGIAGPLGLAVPWQARMDLGHVLAVRTLSVDAPSRGDITVHLATTAVDAPLSVLTAALSVQPPVPYAVHATAQGLDLVGAFEAGVEYRIAVAERWPEASPLHPLAAYPAGGSWQLAIPARRPGLWLDGPATGDGRLPLGAQAVEQASVEVLPLVGELALSTSSIALQAGDDSGRWNAALDGDQLFAGLPSGRYRLRLRAGDDPQASAEAEVTIEEIPLRPRDLAVAVARWYAQGIAGGNGSDVSVRRLRVGR